MVDNLSAGMDFKGKLLMGKYHLGRLLGQGNFAKVYQANDIINDQNVAIKVIEKEKSLTAGMMNQMKREISVTKLVKHPNIIHFYEVLANKNKIYIVMELAKGGELFDQVTKGKLKEHIARKYFQQLISAVGHCHNREVYHRDLKLENLLLDENGNIKVSDFGLSALSKTRHENGLLYTTCGTPEYVPPEVIRRRGYDGAKADIWSCGVILYAMLSGKFPFHSANLLLMYKKICYTGCVFPRWFSTEVRDLLSQLLDPNPNTRISIPQIMQNPWFMKGLDAEFKTLARQDADTVPRPSESSNAAIQAAGGEFKAKVWNAFDIIAHSDRFSLSSLFAENDQTEEVWFTSKHPVSTIISKLEDIAKTLNLTITKKDAGLLKLQGFSQGGLERVTLDAEIFELTSSLHLVEIKNSDGCTLEFQKIIHVVRSALDEIVWIWQCE